MYLFSGLERLRLCRGGRQSDLSQHNTRPLEQYLIHSDVEKLFHRKQQEHNEEKSQTSVRVSDAAVLPAFFSSINANGFHRFYSQNICYTGRNFWSFSIKPRGKWPTARVAMIWPTALGRAPLQTPQPAV